MTTEDKLKHFLEAAIESATAQSTKLIDDYSEGLERIFEGHKLDMQRKTELQLRLGKDNLEREVNKELSREQINIKRETSENIENLKDMLFHEVEDLLEEYMATPEYKQLLIEQIRKAAAFAGKNEISIYIDPADSSELYALEAATGTRLIISEVSFMGGTRAVIKSKNILIDNSFETRLKEAKEAFTFHNK